MPMYCSPLKKPVVSGLTAVALILIATGCGGGSSNVSIGGNVMATLTASPSQIMLGQTATLSWTTTNATSAQIDNGVGTVQTGSGSVTVTPTQTTTYTITATGSDGTQATAQAAVSVSAASLQSIQHVIFMLQENR